MKTGWFDDDNLPNRVSNKQLRAELQTALQNLATGDLRNSATALLATLGYASHKTLELPTQPQAFATEVENLLGGSKQLNPVHASLADWQSAAFLFQLTNDELPALAAGQASLLTETGGVQAWQVESFVFLALDLKPGTWSRTRLAALTRELNRLFPMPAVLLFRHPRNDAQVSDVKNDVSVLNWDSTNENYRVSDFPDVFAAERFGVPQRDLKRDGWQLEPPTKRQLLARIRKAGQPLGEYCKGRFYYGIKTGLNEAFVITREQRDALVALDPKSADIIKPFLRGRDVKRWNVESQDL